MVNVGTNITEGVLFPFSLGNQYFRLYDDEHGKRVLDIIRWDAAAREGIFEVKASQPLTSGITTNPTGVVTFTTVEGGFAYKFRPRENMSNIFGAVPAGDGIEVRVDDGGCSIVRNGEVVVDTKKNQIFGVLVGWQLLEDGSFVMGSNQLPDGMLDWVRSALSQIA